MAEFLARAPWDEQKDGPIATQSERGKHLNSHNLICRRLTEMLERLPTEVIPMAESKILQQVHRIQQNSMLLSWPQEGLRLETCTPGFEDIISEIAQFESQRLGFLFPLNSTLLEIHDKFSSTPKIENAEPQSHLAPFLDMRPPLKWWQLILPAELTHSLLKSTTLHDHLASSARLMRFFCLQPILKALL